MKIGMLFVATMFGRAFAALPRTAVSYLGFLPAFFRLGISNARIAYALGLSKNVGRLTAKIYKRLAKENWGAAE